MYGFGRRNDQNGHLAFAKYINDHLTQQCQYIQQLSILSALTIYMLSFQINALSHVRAASQTLVLSVNLTRSFTLTHYFAQFSSHIQFPLPAFVPLISF